IALFAATVTLTPTAGSGAGVTISVSYQPGSSNQPAVLTVIPSSDNPNYPLTLGYNTNGILPQQSISVSAGETYSASVTYDTSGSLQLAVGQGLALTVSTVPASQLLNVQLSQAAATLTTGTYSGIVVINAGGLQATIGVTISVNGGAGSVLTVNPGSLAFAYQNGGQLTLIPAQTLVTTSPTGSSFTATATSDKGWLFL